MPHKTGLVFFPAFDWAVSPTHPEREERLLYTRDQLFEEGIMDLPQIKEYKPRKATVKDISRTHFCIPSVEEQTLEAHRIAAGGALVLADALFNSEIHNGFALVRPPGHHAMKVVRGNRGFCSINNEAIMVDYLKRQYGVKKIAIVDTDVHHGDGTQDIFYHDPDVLFISFHQDGRTLFPGTGFLEELGGPKAFARNINIPLPPGTGDKGIHYVLDNLILPIIKDFCPDVVVNSAGQDNHYTDPLANMKFTAQGYAELTKKLKPDLAVLEGGYAVETALPFVNMAITLAMAGIDYSYIKEPDFSPEKTSQSTEIDNYIKKLTEQVLNIWSKKDRFDVEKMYNRGDFFLRNKNIFYDTSFINERQVEMLRKCNDCNGYLTIETTADNEVEGAYCISIPVNSCPKCEEEAMTLYNERKNRAQQKYLYLQNKKADIFNSYNHQKQEETEII